MNNDQKKIYRLFIITIFLAFILMMMYPHFYCYLMQNC